MFVLLRLALTSVSEVRGYGTNSHLKVTNLELSIEKIQLGMECLQLGYIAVQESCEWHHTSYIFNRFVFTNEHFIQVNSKLTAVIIVLFVCAAMGEVSD